MVEHIQIEINYEHKKKLKGPYDLYEDLDDLKPSYFDTEHFKYLVGEEEPPYNGR